MSELPLYDRAIVDVVVAFALTGVIVAALLYSRRRSRS